MTEILFKCTLVSPDGDKKEFYEYTSESGQWFNTLNGEPELGTVSAPMDCKIERSPYIGIKDKTGKKIFASDKIKRGNKQYQINFIDHLMCYGMINGNPKDIIVLNREMELELIM